MDAVLPKTADAGLANECIVISLEANVVLSSIEFSCDCGAKFSVCSGSIGEVELTVFGGDSSFSFETTRGSKG